MPYYPDAGRLNIQGPMSGFGTAASGLMGAGQKFMGMRKMAEDRRKGLRMQELAKMSIDPQTGQLNQRAFMSKLAPEFPMEAQKLSQMMQEQQAQQVQAQRGTTKFNQGQTDREQKRLTDITRRFMSLPEEKRPYEYENFRSAIQQQGINAPGLSENMDYNADKGRLEMMAGMGQQFAGANSRMVKAMVNGKPAWVRSSGTDNTLIPMTVEGERAEVAFAPRVKEIGDQVVDRSGNVLWEVPQTRSEKIKDDMNTRGWAQLTLDKKTLELKESPGWQKIDEAFAKDYNTLVSQGGLADAIKGVDQMRVVEENLKSGMNLTGAIISLIPPDIRKRTNPESMNTQELLEEVVQRNLKVILGAQFTEGEGTRLIARAYNPALKEEINARRVGRLLKSMESALSAKLEAISYFEKNNGTLRGYKSKALESAIKKLRGLNFTKPVDSTGKRQATFEDF